MLACVEQIADCALEHFKSEQFRAEASAAPGLGRDACAYGRDEDLVGFIQT